MRSLSSIGLGLSLVFACLLVALMGEIYYLLWWKRRTWNRGISQDYCCSSTTTTTSSSAREFMDMFCCKKSTQSLDSNSSTVSFTVRDRFQLQQNETQNNRSNNKELLMLKSDGPQRLLLSTIKEETREDLESEDGTLSDLVVVHDSSIVDIETPYLTPLSSPSMLPPPLTPLNSSYTTHIGFKFNPLFESSSDAELSKLKASPPPKFKFLQEAENKFQRRMMMMEEAEHLNDIDIGCIENEGERPENRFKGDESFITIIVAKGRSGHKGGQLV